MMRTMPQRSIGWMGIVALGFGGINLTIYTTDPLVSQYGSCVIPLFIAALILTLVSSFGYLELVLMYPEKSGGISVACTDAFRAYSPILTNILGVSYCLAWLMAASFGSHYLATVIQQIIPWL